MARELGVSHATVYRYFPSTEALLFASSVEAEGGFLDRLAAHVSGIRNPVDIVIEAIAFTIEQLPRERYLSVVLASRRGDLPSESAPRRYQRVWAGSAREDRGRLGRGGR